MIEDKIIELTNSECVLEAKKISDEAVLPSKTLTILGSDKILKYTVMDGEEVYTSEFILKKDEIIGMHCSCFDRDTKCCKHLAKILLKHYKEFFPKLVSDGNKLINEINISKTILNYLYNEYTYKPSTKLNLEVELSFIYNVGILVNFRIGTNKLYVLGNKMNHFLSIYGKENEELELGKKFIYNNLEYYFDEIDNKIIEFCRVNYQNTMSCCIPNNLVDSFMELLKNKKVYINNILIDGINYSNPYSFSLKYNNGLYELILEDELKYRYLDYDKNYCLKDGKLYKVPKKIKNILNSFSNFNVNSLLFSKEEVNKFYKVFGDNLDNNVKIDENIKNEFIVIKPKVNLYFDLIDNIICLVKFYYNENEINYFDENVTFLRNNNYEDDVIKSLTDIGFIIDNKEIYLKDNDLYVPLLEDYLPLLSKKYNVFTTEKFDKMKFKKKINVKSHFSIGMDNIFRYDFDLDGMDNKELASLFNEMECGKKYYRFKNGTIVNLEDEKLKELKTITDELNLDYDEMESGTEYVIPKYRAIYLDSLKKENSIIETNNLFSEFVSNFKNVKKNIIDDKNNILRDYQVTGVNWLLNIYNYGFGGILADEMGLGKSVQVIYFIKELLKENNNFKFLIVSPTSLIYNWANEFKKFGDKTKYLVCAGTRTIRGKLFKEMDNYNVVITSYGLVREDFEKYVEKNFEVIILDEAQNIKNPRAEVTKSLKKLNSNIKLALTGTPLENSVSELWSIFDFIMPGYLNSLKRFEEKYIVNDLDEAKDILNVLNTQISPFILRRRKKDVLKSLPPKIDNNIYLDLNDKQKKIYLDELDKTKKEMDDIIKTEGFLKARFKILSLLTKLRQICIDPKIVYDSYKDGSVKIDELLKTIEVSIYENHKILIFTSFLGAIDIVSNELKNKNIKYYIIDGSVSSIERQRRVDEFNNSIVPCVFLISLKAGGTGLNLTSADIVIHLDMWWNPQVEAQATDRAHRIGQKRSVEVIKFICKGTIEERILELQEKKKKLSDALIEGDLRNTDLIENITEEEFKKLLSYSEE